MSDIQSLLSNVQRICSMEDEDLTEEQLQRFTDRLLIQVPRDREADNTKTAMSQVEKAFSDIIQEVDQ